MEWRELPASRSGSINFQPSAAAPHLTQELTFRASRVRGKGIGKALLCPASGKQCVANGWSRLHMVIGVWTGTLHRSNSNNSLALKCAI